MTVQEAWLIALAVATPLSGVVGFAIQLREVKRQRLENERLVLELPRIRGEIERQQQRLVIPTTDEVVRYAPPGGDVRFRGPCPGDDGEPLLLGRPVGSTESGRWLLLKLAIVLLLVAYAIFDVYRLFGWLAAKVS